jgi:hypothetical protein
MDLTTMSEVQSEADSVFAYKEEIDLTDNISAINFKGDLIGNASTANALANLYTFSTRPTNANITHVENGGVVHFKATSSMTSNKPVGDGHILHFHWDGDAWNS